MHVHNRTQKALQQGAQNSAPQRTKHQTSSYRESLDRSCKWESCILHTHTISVLAVLDITLFSIYYDFENITKNEEKKKKDSPQRQIIKT